MNVSTSDRNNTPPDLSRNVAERNVDNTESACFGKAIRRFQEKHPDKFKVLLSISPKKSLAYEDILASFKLVADKQNENNNLRRCLGRLCETLQQFKQTALTGARADAVAPYVVGGLFVFMQLSIASGYPDFIIATLSEITRMMTTWYHFERRILNLRDPTLSEIQKDTADLCGHLTDLFFQGFLLASSIIWYSKRNGLEKFGQRLTHKEHEWRNDLEALKRTENECKTSRDLINTESKLQEENASILDWITKTNQKREHHHLREKIAIDDVYKGCGKWLFETDQYRNWKAAQVTRKPVLWLKGTVGTGKTTLMCRAIDKLVAAQRFEHPGEHRVIYYYCTGSKPGESRSNHNSCLRALIRQLAIKPNSLSVADDVRYEYGKRRLHDPKDCRFSVKECEELLGKLIPCDAKKLRTTIIIDALDECEGDVGLLTSLKELLGSRRQTMRLLLSSQIHIPVEDFFRDIGIVSISISPTQTKVDMRYFIHQEIKKQQLDPRPGILKTRPELRKEVEDTLLNRAGGMFQWVKLRIAVFFPTKPLESTERVETELRRLKAANPKDLNQTYKRLYMENENERVNTAKTYRIILSAYRPLTIAEVAEAVSARADGKIDPDVDVEYIRRRCHNFVVENDSGVLEFSHESARLFLEKPEYHGDNNFVDVDDFSHTANHREMAKICLQIMANCHHRIWARVRPCSARWKHQSDPTHGEQAHLKIFSQRGFAQYVIFFWVPHCFTLSSNHSLGQELCKKLTEVLSEPQAAFSWWLSIPRYEPILHVLRPSFPLRRDLRSARLKRGSGFSEVDILGLLARSHGFMENPNFEAGSFPPHKLFAICVWDFIECLEDGHDPRLHHILRDEKWSSTPFSPLHICSYFGSIRVLRKLLKDYPEEVSELISLNCFTPRLSPFGLAVARYYGVDSLESVRALLEFERGHARDRARDHKPWRSKQLSSLRSLAGIMDLSMLRLLLEFEASQTGAHFPPRSGESWTSDLAQQSSADGVQSPLQYAAQSADADVVSLLLEAGACSSIPSDGLSPLAEALSGDAKRYGKRGSRIVDILVKKDRAFRDNKVMDEHYVLELGSKLSTEAAARMLKVRPELAVMQRADGKTALEIALETPYTMKWRNGERLLRDPAFFKVLEEYQNRQGYKVNHEKAQAIRQQVQMLKLHHHNQRRLKRRWMKVRSGQYLEQDLQGAGGVPLDDVPMQHGTYTFREMYVGRICPTL